MIKPTCGRVDHSKGYIKGNFNWQSSKDNLIEVRTRTKLKMERNNANTESR